MLQFVDGNTSERGAESEGKKGGGMGFIYFEQINYRYSVNSSINVIFIYSIKYNKTQTIKKYIKKIK